MKIKINPLYYLLVFAAVALVMRIIGGVDPIVVFIIAALGLIPLAKLIGDATEELAIYTGPRLGGLLNATLGNAAELIITIIALNAGLVELVKASITGSIIGNLLLVTGFSLLAGGLKNGTQFFNRRTAGSNATLMMLAVAALAIPSLFDSAIVSEPSRELLFSEGVAVIIIIVYALSVVYTFTHKEPALSSPHEGGYTFKPAANAGDAPTDSTPSGVIIREAAAEEVHTARWSLGFCIAVLAGATIATAIVSEILVGAVEPVVQQLGLTEFFLGLIVIPLIGNVAEHMVAVQVALKNKMELSLAVSMGSSLQIALFVAPVLVFISLLMGGRLLLVFTPYELIALFVAGLITALISLDGESNWLEGAMLLAVYLIIAIAFFVLPDAAGAVHESSALLRF
ncbi:MAG: calcium/proton exchanger [Anaerolineae bacterium]